MSSNDHGIIALLLTDYTEENLSSKVMECLSLYTNWIRLCLFLIITYVVYFPGCPYIYTPSVVCLILTWNLNALAEALENSKKGAIDHQIRHRITISFVTGLWSSFLADRPLSIMQGALAWLWRDSWRRRLGFELSVPWLELACRAVLSILQLDKLSSGLPPSPQLR